MTRSVIYASLLLFLLVPTQGQAQDPSERAQIEAVFIYRFMSYVTWPEDFKPGVDGTIIIGVLGESALVEPLLRVASSESTPGRPIEVRLWNSIPEITDCHVFVLADGRGAELELVLDHLTDRPTLIVTQEPDLTRSGAHISFLMNQGRIRFQINNKAARGRGLKISSQLLKLAIPVE